MGRAMRGRVSLRHMRKVAKLITRNKRVSCIASWSLLEVPASTSLNDKL